MTAELVTAVRAEIASVLARAAILPEAEREIVTASMIEAMRVLDAAASGGEAVPNVEVQSAACRGTMYASWYGYRVLTVAISVAGLVVSARVLASGAAGYA